MIHVESNADSALVPSDVFDADRPLDFVEGGTEVWNTEEAKGWFARLSAPGTMDCTDWSGPFETEHEARAYLFETYSVCPWDGCGGGLDDDGTTCRECGTRYYGTLTDRPDYVGDRDYLHGGAWFHVAEWRWGYVPAVEVCPVPGFDGAVWISHYVTLTPEVETLEEALEDKHVKDALSFCGMTADDLRDVKDWRLRLASMLFDLGRKDPDDMTTTVVVMTTSDGALEGADHRIPDGPALDLFLAERITWEPHTDGDDDPDPDAGDGDSEDLAAIAETLLGSAVAGVFMRTFDAMEIAEDEIKRGKRRHPDSEEEIHGAFMILRPTDILSGKPLDPLYRLHARELVERVAAGEDPAPATDAEVLASLSAASLAAPLTGPAVALYMRLFHDVYGSGVGRAVLGDDVADRIKALYREYGPLIEDLEIAARRKAGDASRKLSRESTELAAA